MSEQATEGFFLAINGQKAGFSDVSNLPPEALALLSSMNSMSPSPKVDVPKISVSQTSPDLKPLLDAQNIQIPSANSLVRARPEIIEKALEQKEILENFHKETNHQKRLTIYEQGIALGIVVGKTNRKEVIEIMKNFSSTYNLGNDPLFYYTDISVSIFFDEQDDLVNELKFGMTYKGHTSKGLGLGDSMEQAVEIYGQPRMKSPRGAIWEKFAVFCENGHITSIRIQK